MALSGYGNRPPLRYPCLLPLYHETALQAEARLRNTVENWRRIDYAQPVVDDGPPKTSINIRIKLKKLLDEGERLARIERNNKFLMKQIVKIMKGPGYVDHFHKNKLSAHSSTQTYLERKLFVEHTNRENKTLLKRILHTKTSYDHIQQEMHYQCKDAGYGDVDMDALHERFIETHRLCVPSMEPGPAFQARPVPKSCASPEGVNHTDHHRCFTPVAYLPPIGRSRSPRTSGAGDVHVRETKAMRLRRTETMRKIKAMQPRPVATSRSPSPASRRNVCKCETQGEKKEEPIEAKKEEPKKESLTVNKAESISRKESNVDTGEVTRKQSQGEERKISQGEGRRQSQGEGRKTSQGEGRKQSQGEGRKQSQGEGRKTSLGQGKKISQGEVRKISQGEDRKTSQGEGSKQSQSQEEDTKSSQEDRNQSKGEERKTSLGEGRKHSQGEESKTSQGEGRKQSKGEERKISQGEGSKQSQGEDSKTSQGEGRKQSQGEGRKTSQGEGRKQSQGEERKISQGEDRKMSQGENRKTSQGEGRKQSLGENRKISQGEDRKISQGEGRKTSQGEGRKQSQGGSQGGSQGEDQGENNGGNKEEDNGESKEGDTGGNANVNQSAALKATRSMLKILAQNPYSMSVLQDRLIPLGPLPSATRGEGRCKEEKTPQKQACCEKDPQRQTENTMKPRSDEIKTQGRDEKLQNNTTDTHKKERDSRPPGQKKEVRLKEQLGEKDMKLQTKRKYWKSTEKMEQRMKAVASVFHPSGVSRSKSLMSRKLSAQAGLVAKKSKTEPSESFSGRRKGSNDKESQSTAPRAEDEHVAVIGTKGSETADSSPVGDAQADSNASPEHKTGQKPSQENFFALALSPEDSPKAALSPKSDPSQSNSRPASATKDTPGSASPGKDHQTLSPSTRGSALAQQIWAQGVSLEEDLLGVGNIPKELSPEKKPTDAAPFQEGSASETCPERETPKLASQETDSDHTQCREGTSEMAVSPKDSSGHSSHRDYTSDASSSKKKSDESSAKLSSPEKDATKLFSSQKDPSKMTSSDTSANNSARPPNRDSRTVDSPEKDTSGNHSVRSDGDSRRVASTGMVSTSKDPISLDLVQKEPPRRGSSCDSSSRSAPSKEYSKDFSSSQNDTCRMSAPDEDSQEPLSSHEGFPRLSLPAKDASRQISPEGDSSRLATRENSSFGNSSSPQKKLPGSPSNEKKLPGSPSNDKESSKSASSRKKRPRSSTEEIFSPIPPPSLAPEQRKNYSRSQRRASRKEPVPQEGTEAGKDHDKSMASEGADAKVFADENTEEVIKEHSCAQEGNTSDDAEELPISSVDHPSCLEQELSSSDEESWREGMYREP